MKKNYKKNYTSFLILFFIFINSLYHSNSIKIKAESLELNSIYKENKKPIYGKAFFIFYRNIDKSRNYLLNNLTKLIFEITNTDLVIFNNKSNSNNVSIDELKNTFLLAIKLGEIDLICADYLYVCTYGQFKKEYQKKLVEYNLELNQSLQNSMTNIFENKENLESNCLIFTIGAFKDINNLPFLCFEQLDELISIQNILSERILRENILKYQGITGMLNQKTNGFKHGILNIVNDKLIFNVIETIKLPKINNKNNNLSINLSAIHNYVTTIYNKENLPWSGDEIYKPDPAKCFRITYDQNANIESNLYIPDKKPKFKNIFFCSFYNRSDLKMINLLSNEMSAFLNGLLVARINLKLHSHNLKEAHKKLSEFKGEKISCNDEIIEPIKYEIRLKYLIIRHKITQLVNLDKIRKEKGIDLIQKGKEKLIDSSCVSLPICTKTLSKCVKEGFLPLKVKGFKLATSLENPYISTLNLKAISYRDKPRSKIGEELMKKTKELLLSTKRPNKLYYDELNHDKPEIPLAIDIKKAFNTFSFYFKGKNEDFTNVQQMGRHCRWISRGSLSHLNKKLFYSSLSMDNDPVLDYLSTIKGFISNN